MADLFLDKQLIVLELLLNVNLKLDDVAENLFNLGVKILAYSLGFDLEFLVPVILA